MSRIEFDSRPSAGPPQPVAEQRSCTVEYALFALACLIILASTAVLMVANEAQRNGIDYGTYVIQELDLKMRSEIGR